MTNFAGISKEDCPAGCNAQGCVITGNPYCAHPCKGGIPARFRTDPIVKTAFDEACKALGVPNPHLVAARLAP